MRLHRTGFIQICLVYIKILQWRQNLSAHLRVYIKRAVVLQGELRDVSTPVGDGGQH